MPVMKIRSLSLTSERAAILRMALAALLERGDLLSDEGLIVARDLARELDAKLVELAPEVAR